LPKPETKTKENDRFLLVKKSTFAVERSAKQQCFKALLKR